MATRLRTKAELRAAFPKAPYWLVETLIAFEREGQTQTREWSAKREAAKPAQ